MAPTEGRCMSPGGPSFKGRPENFEILGRGRCDFLHFGAKILVQTNILTHPK